MINSLLAVEQDCPRHTVEGLFSIIDAATSG